MLETHMATTHPGGLVDCRLRARPSRPWRQSIAALAAISALCAFEGGTACIRMPAMETTAGTSAAKEGGPSYGPFKLKADFAGPCVRAEVVDVDLGHTPESLVRAAH